jgi:hypothetical protein
MIPHEGDADVGVGSQHARESRPRAPSPKAFEEADTRRSRDDEGHVVVDSIVPITLSDITFDLARASGFESVEDLLGVARHGAGENVYLIRFHYLPPGAWDVPRKQPRRGIEPE